jgi:hypothetical protein
MLLQQFSLKLQNLTMPNPSELELQYALHDNILTDLLHLGMIKVSGNDAEFFLQGQFTNDVRQVNTTQSQLSAWCSPKGRILVNFRLFQRADNAYYLLMPQANVAATLKRLPMYVLRSQVKLENVSGEFSGIGVAGTHSTQLLASCLGGSLPSTVNNTLTTNLVTVLHIQGPTARYIVLSEDVPTLQSLWQGLVAGGVYPAGTAVWDLLDILAGVPNILPPLVDEFVPQMVNYQALGGVNFKKGCYSGQEIVARMQYLGTLKRRMYLVKIDTTLLPPPGAPLYVSSETPSVGQIVNAQPHPDGGVIALAVISISHTEKEEVHLHSQQGEVLELLVLPYLLGS